MIENKCDLLSVIPQYFLGITGLFIAFHTLPVRQTERHVRQFVGSIVMVLFAVSPSFAQSITLNLSNQSNVNMATLRGFDPTTITGPSDPFPDTSNPFPPSGLGGCTSSQFGCGIAAGSSGAEVMQNCDTGGAPAPAFTVTTCTPLTLSSVTHLGEAFQSLQNGLLSRLSTETSSCAGVGPSSPNSRCTEIEYKFSQNVVEKGQVFDMSFSVRSLTDASGNPIGSQGSYTQTLSEDGVTSTCGGTFTFDGNTADVNGDGRPDGLALNGPAHQC